MDRYVSRPVTPPTLADVAEVAGVSRQTVSNAINNPDLLREDTLARVQEAIDQLGYLPNRAARNLRTRASQLIGLCLPRAHEGARSALLDRFVRTLVESSRGAGYHVLLFSTDEDDPFAGYDDLLRSTAVDAFIVPETHLGNDVVEWLMGRRAKFVAFGRPWGNPHATYPWVDIDTAKGSEAATRHLIDRGHTKIAWIGWRKGSVLGEERRLGWARTMHAAGLPMTGLASRVEDIVTSGRAAAEALLDESSPTAFVCATDALAMGVLNALDARGLKVGIDVAVVGYGDSPVSQMVPGGLTTIRQPLEDAAVALVEALESLLSFPPTIAAGLMLEPKLIVRGSS